MSNFDLFVIYASIRVFVFAIIGIAVSSLWENLNKKSSGIRKKEGTCKNLEHITEYKENRKAVKIAHNNGNIDIRISGDVA